MAGYSKRTLVEKLGIKSGYRCFFANIPQNYLQILGALPAECLIAKKYSGEFDFIHAFFENAKECDTQLAKFKAGLKSSGMLWVSWRKGKVSDLSENFVREVALREGLVDVKVCAVDETWSGLKLVYRLKDR